MVEKIDILDGTKVNAIVSSQRLNYSKSVKNYSKHKGHENSIFYNQRKAVWLFFIYFILLVVIGLILSGFDFNSQGTEIFESFENYTNYMPSLPTIKTVLEEFSSLTGGTTLIEFVQTDFIQGDWGWFSFLQDFLNVLIKPFAFIGVAIRDIVAFVLAFIRAFV